MMIQLGMAPIFVEENGKYVLNERLNETIVENLNNLETQFAIKNVFSKYRDGLEITNDALDVCLLAIANGYFNAINIDTETPNIRPIRLGQIKAACTIYEKTIAETINDIAYADYNKLISYLARYRNGFLDFITGNARSSVLTCTTLKITPVILVPGIDEQKLNLVEVNDFLHLSRTIERALGNYNDTEE